MSKPRYLYVDGEKIPVSEEIYKVYYHFSRKERYFSEDLKQEKLLYDSEQQIAVLLPSREDSYERLIVDCNIANAEHREPFLNVQPGMKPISAQS